MVSKVVVTYKRKRLFSRTDHSPLNLHSDKPFEPSESKASAKVDNHVEPIALQSKDTKFETCPDYSEDKVGENMLQCENRDSEYCAQEKSEAENNSPNSVFVKSSSEYEEKCEGTFSNEENVKDVISSEGKCRETLSNCSHHIEEVSNSGTFSSEEKIALNKDQCSSLCDNLGTKRKLGSTLITFSRRSKRNKDNAAKNDNIIASEGMDKCASTTPLAVSCSLDVKNEEISLPDAHSSFSFSAPAATVAMHVDNSFDSPHKTAENEPTTVFPFKSREEISSLGENACMDVQDNQRTCVKPQDSSIEDVNSRISSLDLSISPPAYRDIDCNIPLDWESDEIHQPGPPLEAVHDSLGSTSLVNNPTSQVHFTANGSHMTASDKGKFIVESPPVKNDCIQLFPEKKLNEMHQLAHDSENAHQLLPPPSRLQSSYIQNFPEQTINRHAPYHSPLYEWAQLHPTEPFPDFLPPTSNALSLSRHLMLLDNVLSRARGKFDFPATWSEEELDSLWIGVRRHGANNFESIIRDRRLHFSPWKTTRDLADRWRDEQYRLFHGPPVTPPLGIQRNPFHEYGARMRPPAHFANLVRNRHFQRPAGTNGYYSNGDLPHWLREVAGTPPGPVGPIRNVAPSVFCKPNNDWYGNSRRPWVNTRNDDHVQVVAEQQPLVIKREEIDLHERQANNNDDNTNTNTNTNNNKQDELIVINSDASSEETISDDHGIRE